MNVMSGASRRVGRLFPVLSEGTNFLDETIGQPIESAETAPHRFIRQAILIASIAILCTVAAAAIFRVNEVSRGSGTLVPDGMEQPVQHFEGGVVESILVREGDLVAKGQPLLRLRDASTLEERELLEHRRADLAAQIAVQTALAEGGKTPDFSEISPVFQREIDANLAAYNAQMATISSQSKQYEAEIEQAQSDLQAIKAEREGALYETEHAARQLQRYETLKDKGLVPAIQHDERRRLKALADASLATIDQRLESAANRLNAAREVLNSYLADTRSQASRRLQGLVTALTAAESELQTRQNRETRLTIAAPMAGVVKSMTVSAPGAVVVPGSTVAVIVPTGTPLVADVRVPASQIGHIRVGMDARVNIATFDYTRYGWITGKVIRISPSSFVTANQARYYLVRIALHHEEGDHISLQQLIAGMDVSADIVTGDKSVLQYVLRPLNQTLSTSFQER